MAGLSTPYPFPFCIVETSDSSLVGDKTENPVGLTWEELFEWYWRFRQCQIVIDFTIDDGGPLVFQHTESGVGLLGDYVNEEGIITFSGPSVETDIVCQSNTNITLNNVATSPDGNTVTMILGIFTSNATGVYCYKFSGLYYPTIRLQAGNVDFVFFSYDVPATVATSLSVSLFGKAVVMYGSANNITGSVDVTTELWWGYNPGSGGDIWDTATGAELRDPFSVQSWT